MGSTFMQSANGFVPNSPIIAHSTVQYEISDVKGTKKKNLS